jgi:alkaline phosphatase
VRRSHHLRHRFSGCCFSDRDWLQDQECSVSIDANGERRPTILEMAKASGRSWGLISTCQITDATPAAFAAHVPLRAAQSTIARQYIEEAQVDVILGGGAVHWYPRGSACPTR